MVRWILRGIAALALIAFLFVASVAGYVWHLGNEAMDRARESGWFDVVADAPTTVFESTVKRAFYGKGWNERAFPCRRVAGQVSQLLASNIVYDEFGHVRTIESSVRRASLRCQLEGRFDDLTLLRMNLKRANFGQGLVGADTAAQAIFGKPAGELDSEESIRLVALYDRPRIRKMPEEWNQRVEFLRERLRQQE